jgi:hypothetical protein
VTAAIELGFLPQWANHSGSRTSSGNIHTNQLNGGSLP